MAKTINNFKNRGFTLTETLTVMVIFSIIALTIGAYYVNEYELRTSIIKRAQMTREARVALRHLTSKLRFAYPDTVSISENGNKIKAEIRGGHLPHDMHQDDIDIEFHYIPNRRELRESYLLSQPVRNVIARNISSFGAEKSDGNSENLIIRIATEIDDGVLEIESGLKMLGDIQEE